MTDGLRGSLRTALSTKSVASQQSSRAKLCEKMCHYSGQYLETEVVLTSAATGHKEQNRI